MVAKFFNATALPTSYRFVLGVVLIVWASWGAAISMANEAAPLDAGFIAVERHLFGSEGTLGLGAFSVSSQVGGVRTDSDTPSAPAQLGEKFKAGLMSLILPGAGQYYNGHNTKAGVFLVAEFGVWCAYSVFNHQGSIRSDTYVQYAGIYAGTSGDYSDSYWQSVGRYLSSDEYNEGVLREERAYSEAEHELITGTDAWQWRSEEFQDNFRRLRVASNSAYSHRDFMLMFAVINRALSVIDAVTNAGKDDYLSMNVLGMNMAVEVSPSLVKPTTQLVFSRKF